MSPISCLMSPITRRVFAICAYEYYAAVAVSGVSGAKTRMHTPAPEISDEVFQANHSVQNEESFENPSNEIATSSSNEEKEEPPQDSNIRQLIREECCVEVCEEQKQKISDEVFQANHSVQNEESFENPSNEIATSSSNEEKEEPPQDSNIRQLIREECCVEVCEEQKQIATILSTKEPEYSSSMGYEHLNITPEMESDEVTKSNAENLLPTPSKCEVTLEDKRECDMPVCEDSSASDLCDNHSEIFSDSKINDDISVYDDFKDIEYVEASLSDPEIVSIEVENVVQQEEEEVDLEDISEIQDIVLREKLLSITRLISNIESLNDNSTPDHVLNSFAFDNSILDNFSPEFETFCTYTEETKSEEADLFLASDNSIPPGIENFADDPERDVCFLEELLIDDSILSNESSDSNFEDNPSIPRPPPELPDAKTDAGEEIPVVMNDKDKFYEDYYFSCLIRILPPVIEVFLCWIFVPVSKIFTSFDLKLVWGSPYPLISIA
nr:hypothetical protein [Tanacetum cinerariifolium]